MATGGKDDGLDLSELESELHALDEDDLDTTNDSLLWEEHKAQFEYEQIEAETSGELEFSGFLTPSTSPTKLKSAINLTQSAPTSPTSLRAHTQCSTKSAPTSPRLAYSSLTVKQRIKSFESLAQVQAQGTNLPVPKKKIKSRTSPKTKSSTRLALKKGLSSPLAKAGNFERKRRQKSKVKKVLPPAPIITMAQVNISGAGRLNPRNRAAGGIGDTLQSLGFPDINVANVPPAGRNVLRRFTPLEKKLLQMQT